MIFGFRLFYAHFSRKQLVAVVIDLYHTHIYIIYSLYLHRSVIDKDLSEITRNKIASFDRVKNRRIPQTNKNKNLRRKTKKQKQIYTLTYSRT